MPLDTGGTRDSSIAAMCDRAKEEYPLLWRRVIKDWRGDGTGNAAWLTYSANYLLRTAGLRWALDPYALSARLAVVPAPDYARDLAGCSLVVLTHAHAGHLDYGLIAALSHFPVQWVIPEHTLPAVLARVDLPSKQIIIPQNGQRLGFGGLSLTPFEGLHRRGDHGIPATGYLVEFD